MVLLDTCTLLWLAAEQSQLSPAAREAIARNAGRLFVSAISAFEIGIKHAKGRLSLPVEADAWFAQVLDFHGLREIPVSGRIAARSTALPPLHADPCDRLIVATALLHDFVIVTPDPLVRSYPGVVTDW